MTELTADSPEATGTRPGWKRLDRADYLMAAVVAVFCVLVEQVWQVRIDLNLADEGLLWHYVQRTLAAEVPVRDFLSYEPGRYYFLAGWALLVHSDGLIALRYGLAVLTFLALFPALLLLLRVLPSRWLLPCFGMFISLWIAPRHKIPDVAAPIWMTYALAVLVVHPNRKSHFMVGFVAAAMWLIGINHVLYAVVSGAIVIVAIGISDRVPIRQLLGRIGWTFAGGLAVTAPVMAWLMVVPHFLPAYWHNAVMRLVETGTTNLTLPIPWPWDVPVPPATWGKVSAYAMAVSFLLFPVMLALAAVVFLWPSRFRAMRQYPVVLAAAATTLTWAHHAFSRADLPHLVQSAAPLVILMLALPEALGGIWRGLMRAVCWCGVAFISLFAAANLSPAIAMKLPFAADYEWCDLAGEELYLPDYTRRDYEAAADVLHGMEPGHTALFMPYDPGLYAAFHLRCPVYNPYPVMADTPSEQQEMIDGIRGGKVDWVFYWPSRADNRADLGFDQTDPLVWNYILKNYDLFKDAEDDRGLMIYHRKASAGN
jgi:hypothetical protein